MNRSENALVATLYLAGDTFIFADPAGQSYTIEETDKRDGKIVEVTRFTVRRR